MLAVVKSFRIFDICLGRGRRPATLGDQVVLRRVDRNAVEPRVKRAVAAKVGQRPVRLDEGLLGHVLDLGRVADQPRQQAEDLALVLDDQQVKRAPCRRAARARPVAGRCRDQTSPAARQRRIALSARLCTAVSGRLKVDRVPSASCPDGPLASRVAVHRTQAARRRKASGGSESGQTAINMAPRTQALSTTARRRHACAGYSPRQLRNAPARRAARTTSVRDRSRSFARAVTPCDELPEPAQRGRSTAQGDGRVRPRAADDADPAPARRRQQSRRAPRRMSRLPPTSRRSSAEGCRGGPADRDHSDAA